MPASPAEVWATILDPDHLAALIPGCHHLERIGETGYRAEATLGVGPVKGRFSAEVEMSDLDPPRALRLTGSATGALGSARGKGEIRLLAVKEGTRVMYSHEVIVGGKIATVGGRLLDGAARAVIARIFKRLAGVGKQETAPGLRAKLPRWLGGKS